jgi:hypothetical protein
MREIGAVKEEPAFAPDANQACALQLLQVK